MGRRRRKGSQSYRHMTNKIKPIFDPKYLEKMLTQETQESGENDKDPQDKAE
jgi:hypothetical protein